MKLKLFAAVLCSVVVGVVGLQVGGAQATPAPAAKPKLVSPPATAMVKLNGADITITYCQPGIHGRTIFGGLVPYGQVWRTGANAATTLATTGALQIGTLKVPAGKYTIYSLPAESGWTLIINKQTGQWGTVYDKAQDLGRVPMETGANATPVENFTISFDKTMGDMTEMHLKWAGVDASVQVSAGK